MSLSLNVSTHLNTLLQRVSLLSSRFLVLTLLMPVKFTETSDQASQFGFFSHIVSFYNAEPQSADCSIHPVCIHGRLNDPSHLHGTREALEPPPTEAVVGQDAARSVQAALFADGCGRNKE